jgi:hypothetical protein
MEEKYPWILFPDGRLSSIMMVFWDILGYSGIFWDIHQGEGRELELNMRISMHFSILFDRGDFRNNVVISRKLYYRGQYNGGSRSKFSSMISST